jgi:hypothetical protein
LGPGAAFETRDIRRHPTDKGRRTAVKIGSFLALPERVQGLAELGERPVKG